MQARACLLKGEDKRADETSLALGTLRGRRVKKKKLVFAPVWRLVLAFVVGKRTQESANLLRHRVAHVTAQRLPWFTSDVERENLTWRQHNRRLTRKTKGFRKALTWLEKHRWLSLASDHLVLPHESLRRRLRAPESTRGQGSTRRWKPVTPAMAAGITDHVWTTQELLSYRVPAAFLDKLQGFDHWFQPIKDTHQGS